jgi:hypothetical protein
MMDFKGWKKIKEDKDTTTMKHDKGHTMTLANKAMPKIQREQLKRLPIQENSGVAFYEEGAAPVQASDANPPAQLNQASMDTPPTQTPSNVPLLNTDQTLNAPAAINLQQKAAREQEAVDISKGIATANMEKAYNDQRTAIAQRDQDNYNDLKGHTDDFKNYIAANPINPNHYQENMGAGEKVASAFGLLMGGFKQGFSGGSNPAMDYLNGQIQRDIDAQKARSENQKTVYGAYEHLYGDANIANNLTKVSMNDIYAHKALQIAAGLATPQAMATANAFAAQKGIENQQLLLDSAGRRGTLQTSPNGPSIQQTTTPAQPGAQNNGIQNIDYKILKPGAEQEIAGRLKYDNSIPDADKAKISSQLTGASQAEKSLASVQDTFERLVKGSREGGIPGRIRRTVSPGALGAAGAALGAGAGAMFGVGPAVGAGLGAAAGEGIGAAAGQFTNTDVNRQYDSDKSRLTSYLSSAVPGRGSELIGELVNKNTPEYGDEVPTLKRKLDAIKEFIKNHTETDALQRHGWSYK